MINYSKCCKCKSVLEPETEEVIHEGKSYCFDHFEELQEELQNKEFGDSTIGYLMDVIYKEHDEKEAELDNQDFYNLDAGYTKQTEEFEKNIKIICEKERQNCCRTCIKSKDNNGTGGFCLEAKECIKSDRFVSVGSIKKKQICAERCGVK